MRVPRKDSSLNDAIDVLQDHYIRCDQDITRAWAELPKDGLVFIENEVQKALDLRYYLENYHFITTEQGVLKSLYPFWDHQEIVYQAMCEEWAANGYCKIIVLKPRQTGISVWTAAAMFHRTIFTPHCFTMIIAQNEVTSEHIYKLSLNAYANLPWWLRPEYMYKTKKGAIEFQRSDEKERLVDPGLGSTLQVSPATQTSGVSIGRTIRALHGSEVSRWPNDEIWESDIKPSLNALDTFQVFESTGYGRQGLFYDQWCAAVDGDSDIRPVWIPVYKVKKYYLPLKSTFELSEEETTFNERIKKEEHFEIPDTFWNFRRVRLRAAKRSGTKAGFLESYPLTPNEAFQSSGLCAFDRDSLEWQEINKVCKPLYAGEISLVSMEPPRFNTDDIMPVADDEILPRRKSGRGGKRMHIWEMPEQGATYYVSDDVALGNGGDFSVANVFRAGQGIEPDTQVATWWGWIPPKKFAHVVAAIGLFYNGAEVANEYMKDGITTGNELRDMDYPNLYRPQFKDRLTHQASNYLHWLTTSKTRDEIIGTMNEALLDRTVVIRDADLLDEMVDFAALETGGKSQGQGNEDDGVLTAMIGLYCLRETTKHLKTSAATEHVRQSGELHIYGVYDNIMRQRGQYNTQAEADGMIKGKAGWQVKPILVCNANTLYSPIFDAMGAEFDLHSKHGLATTEITPDLVWSYKQAMANAGPGRGLEDFGDEW
jgi:hypothetical protein